MSIFSRLLCNIKQCFGWILGIQSDGVLFFTERSNETVPVPDAAPVTVPINHGEKSEKFNGT